MGPSQKVRSTMSEAIERGGAALDLDAAEVRAADRAARIWDAGECGPFALAKRSGCFPPELVDTFEPVVQEEGRHIIFFVNWVAWHRRNLPAWRRILFAAKIVSVWAFLIWERIGFAEVSTAAGRR